MASPKTLLLLAKAPKPDLKELILRAEEPRAEYLELARRVSAPILDFHSVEASPHWTVAQVNRRAGKYWGLALLGALRRKEFDNIYATGEDVGIPLAMLLSAARCYGKLVMVAHNVDTPKRRLIFRALNKKVFQKVIVLSSHQKEVLVQDGRFPEHLIERHYNWIDERFYKPAEGEGKYVLSVGMESRDYPTLQRAAEQLPSYRFHVVASGWSPGAGYGAAGGISGASNIEVGRGYSTTALRDLYVNARFVLVPLKHVRYAAGVTAILEGMAMGKAVITSRSPGILDYVQDGVSGRVVPVGDATALRGAITELWENPQRADEMGRRNRKWIEDEVKTDLYVEKVAQMMGVPKA